MQVRINIPAVANVLAALDGPQPNAARYDGHLKRLREAFPDRMADVYADPEFGGYVAVSSVVNCAWWRGLPAHCFPIGADLSAAPSFAEYGR